VKAARNVRIRRPLRPWTCPLCEREVLGFSMWLDGGNISAIYFHGDTDRHFVADHGVDTVVSHISEIDIPR